MTWDETKFHDPRQFKPERFLPKPEGAGEVFPANAVFGWGRRSVPGLPISMIEWLSCLFVFLEFALEDI